MKYILTLTLLLLTLLPASAVKKIEANPIYIAASLVEKTDSANVASILEYYGYNLQDSENGYCIMRHPNGSEIRFSFNENGHSKKYPTVTVKHNATHKDITERLKELDYEKSGNGYVRARTKTSRYLTQCTTGRQSTLTFRRIQR